MKISIITIVYNRMHMVANTIESVLAQSHNDIEYIVVDGGSTDGTLEILEQYRNAVTTIISEPDDGIYDALNKGIRLATGTIVGVLHSDDVFAGKQVLSEIDAVFNQNIELDAVFGDVSFVSAVSKKPVRYYSSANFTVKNFEAGFMPAHTSFFCRRECFEKFGYYRTDMRIGADFDLLIRFFVLHKIKTRYLPLCTTIMTVGGKSTSGIKSALTINREFYRALSEHGLTASYLKLYSRYFKKWKEFFVRKHFNVDATIKEGK